MKKVVPLSLLLCSVLTSIVVGYPPPYYVYMVHEILLILIFFWFISLIIPKDYLRKALEVITLFFLVFFMILSPINRMLAPEYDSTFTDDPAVHTGYLAEIVGERPYASEGEKKASAYIEDVLEEKGFTPLVDGNIIVINEGRKDAVIFCAHYDTVPGSPGADDNASGVAVLLGLTIPESPEHTIVLAFFTGEEIGMIGSRYYADHLDRKVSGVICVDTVGVGDSIHISSLKENRWTSFFLSQVIYGLSEKGDPSIGPLYSDHVPFNEKGIRAVGITRSTDRIYPHIHSELDNTVDSKKIAETGKIIQDVVLHFSHSEHPYLFVYESVIISILISVFLSVLFQNLMKKIEVLKE